MFDHKFSILLLVDVFFYLFNPSNAYSMMKMCSHVVQRTEIACKILRFHCIICFLTSIKRPKIMFL
jgi:hypothetical protein